MRSITTTISSFSQHTQGTVAIIFGLSAIGLCGAVAIALDTARVYNAASRVQAVIDAAALAAARKMNLEEAGDSEVRQTALEYFNSQKDLQKSWANAVATPEITVNRAASTVTMTVPMKMETITGGIVGSLPQFKFAPTTTASFDVNRIELAMVLDITGSMAWAGTDGRPKLDGLKEAAEDIIKLFSNTTSAPGLIRVGLVPYSASVNAGAYFNPVTWGWFSDTCVVERSGPNAYTDDAPGGLSYMNTSSVAAQPYYSCPPSPVVPLTDMADIGQRNALIDHVKSMVAVGGTAGHIGAAWGWYMVSPKWTGIWPTSADPRPHSPTVTKAVLLMTDGDFNIAYENGGGGLPSPSNTDILTDGSSPNQAKKLCDAMKADGVKIYSVAFLAPPAAEALLKDCSGMSGYYDASNTAELKSAFRSIADKLTALRISK